VYTSLLGNMADVENKKISEWGKSIEASSQSKLRNPLLRREMMEVNLITVNGSPTVSMALIFVNFDPLLVQLLREVKYFVLFGLQIPEMAMYCLLEKGTMKRPSTSGPRNLSLTEQ